MTGLGPKRTVLASLVVALLVGSCSSAPRTRPEPASSEPARAGRASSARVPVAADTDRILLTLHPGPPRRWQRTVGDLRDNFGLVPLGLWPIDALDHLPCVMFQLPEGRDPNRLMERLTRDPRVESVQPVQTFHTLTDTSTGAAPRQDAPPPATGGAGDPYAQLQKGSRDLGVPAAHRWATGRGVRVAVIDTGVDFRHPDLVERMAAVQDFVRRGDGEKHPFPDDIHGTAMAGALAASAGNGVGIVGIAPEAKILAIRACWQEREGDPGAACDSYTLAQGLDFAISEGARIINLSLAGPRDPILARLVRAAIDRGIPVIAAARSPADPGFPASEEGVVAVAAAPTDEVPDREAEGARDPEDLPVLTAPGVDILTTVPRDGYDFLSGSSLAAAQVSGVAALIAERRPDLGPAELAALLRRTAHPSNPHDLLVVDACSALAEAIGAPAGACADEPPSAP